MSQSPEQDDQTYAQQISVLVADDDDSFREWLVTYLTRQNIKCQAVSSSQPVIGLLGQNDFDAIIVDIKMEGNERLDLVKAVLDTKTAIPIILVTGYPSIDSAVKAVQLPVAGYLIKPFEPESLLSLLKVCVLRYRMLKSLLSTRSKLVDLNAGLEEVEKTLRAKHGDTASFPIDSYLSVLLQHLLPSAQEVNYFMESLAEMSQEYLTHHPEPSSEHAHDTEAVKLEDHVSVLQETVNALKRTKNIFKSRELGRLRKKLEIYLRHSTTGK